MTYVNFRFDVNDIVHPIWILLKKCPTCGQLCGSNPLCWQVLPPCKITAISFRHERKPSFSGDPQGINYSFDRRNIPYSASEADVFGTPAEAEAECARRNRGSDV